MLHFSKYQGLGNDFLLVDARQDSPAAIAFAALERERIQRLCDRRFGIGADGVIAALPPQAGGDVRMRIFNADGSEPEMCGNGIRCLARFLADSDGDQPGHQWQVETLAGRIVPELLEGGMIRVDMGAPFLEPQSIPTTLALGASGLAQGRLEVEGQSFEVAAVGMGNPHVVIPVADVAAVDLERYGAALEVHPAFPAKVNVHFVQVLNPEHLVMRVWERGAGPTLACGTGACATLVACQRLGLCATEARIDLPGGPLTIAWSGDAAASVWMSGPAEAVFDGMVTPELWGEMPNPAQQHQPAPSPVERRPDSAQGSVDCATACVNGCVRPDDCPSAEARARAMALLERSSLDDLVNLAADSLESRTRARIERGL
ncbi:MAG: diaminopimelate epimerase [Prochlorococcaceae cyanobacterium]